MFNQKAVRKTRRLKQDKTYNERKISVLQSKIVWTRPSFRRVQCKNICQLYAKDIVMTELILPGVAPPSLLNARVCILKVGVVPAEAMSIVAVLPLP